MYLLVYSELRLHGDHCSLAAMSFGWSFFKVAHNLNIYVHRCIVLELLIKATPTTTYTHFTFIRQQNVFKTA